MRTKGKEVGGKATDYIREDRKEKKTETGWGATQHRMDGKISKWKFDEWIDEMWTHDLN